ncbi:hypothetical protein BKA57DRAFT_504347 [Linnemannia elongata]|nr:hypothetical protein BKA57DRAFT_504347 [Linnemannia elongata]
MSFPVTSWNGLGLRTSGSSKSTGHSLEEATVPFSTQVSPAQVDEALLDYYLFDYSFLNDYGIPPFQTAGMPLLDDIWPGTEVSSPPSLDGSRHTAPVQLGVSVQPPDALLLPAAKNIKTKPKPIETIKPKPARKAETKRPRKHECQFPGCTKAYTTLYSLTSHANSQHGDINYQCLFCNKAYSRYGDCARHEDTKHRMKRWKCKWCPQKYTRNPSAKQQEGCLNGRPRHCFKIIFLKPYAGLS